MTGTKVTNYYKHGSHDYIEQRKTFWIPWLELTKNILDHMTRTKEKHCGSHDLN